MHAPFSINKSDRKAIVDERAMPLLHAHICLLNKILSVSVCSRYSVIYNLFLRKVYLKRLQTAQQSSK